MEMNVRYQLEYLGINPDEFIETMKNFKFDDEFDLDESTCTPEALAYLNRTDEEEAMTDEEWKALYAQRVKEGYYEKSKREISDSELPF